MKKTIIILMALVAVMLASCKKSDPVYTQDEIEFNKWPDKLEIEGVGTFCKIIRDTASVNFMMGEEQGSDTSPIHRVRFSKSFYMGAFEVTQELWESIMGSNPSDASQKGNEYPVNNVSMKDIKSFIEALNTKTGRVFRLPTEAEWEYCASGGVLSHGYKYSGSDNVDDVAWYAGNSGSMLQKVGTKTPNELGLYDMSGNVAEWCCDKYAIYPAEEQLDPMPDKGSRYNIRGGRFDEGSEKQTVKIRTSDTESQKFYALGFRLYLTEPLKSEWK